MGQKPLSVVMAVLLLASACASRAISPSAAAPSGNRSYDLHMEQGLSFLAQGNYGRAAAELRAAVTISPGSPKAHNYLGLCYFHQKDLDLAREQFEKAVALEPSFATAYNNLAGVYSVKSQFDKAEEFYRKALTISPDLISANYSLGILISNLGQAEEGARFLSRGIALDPNYLENNRDLVITFSSRSFDMKETYFTYAKAYASAGNVDKTVDYLGKAREAGFMNWPRILKEKEFEKVRNDPRVKDFLKEPGAL